jgi:outer membrane protein OmpA-like peptidoglycan-associated protein
MQRNYNLIIFIKLIWLYICSDAIKKHGEYMNFKYLALVLAMLVYVSTYADGGSSCETSSGKARRMYEKSIELLQTGQKEKRREAYKLLIEAVKIDRSYADANFALGDINYQKSKVQVDKKKKEQLINRSLKYFNKVQESCPSANDFEVSFFLGEINYKKQDYQQTKKHLNQYLSQSQKQYHKAKADEMMQRVNIYFDLINNPVEFNPVKVNGINTNDDEFLPMISPDGELAIYTHRYHLTDPNTTRGKVVDELSISKRSNSVADLNEVFEKGTKMPLPFNEEGLDQGAMSMTIDNKELYITICKFVKSSNGPFKNCDIYVSYNRDGQWSKLMNLGPNVNGKYSWESQPSISADGKRLYFASIRPTNVGFDYTNNQTADIYYSTKQANGSWSKAKNLGKTINTSGNEKSPFLHTDSKTLYFSSDYHPGIGGYDIFYAKETETGWKTPVNIGYPINKESNDVGFFVSTNGKKAYFSSDELDEVKRWNIYSFNLHEKARPEKVLFAKGRLVNEEGEALTDAKVEIRTSKTKKVTQGMVDKETGDYAIAVAVEKDEEVLMTVKKEGHAFSSKYFKPEEEKKTDEPIKIDMEVKKVEVGKTVQINDIYFATNSAMFMKGSLFILDNFVDYLKENPNIKIEIHGHTDNVGNTRANKKLSEDRAQTVRDYIVFQGIDQSRIIAHKGFGESKPIASNSTEKGRAKNRRTEFVIVSQ